MRNFNKNTKILLSLAILAIMAISYVSAFGLTNPIIALAATGCDIQLQSTVSSLGNNNLSYDMTVANNGSATCNSATLTVYYTAGETNQVGTPKPTAPNYYWNLGNLAAGASTKVNIKTTYSGNNLSTEACATANNGTDSCFTNTDPSAAPIAPPADNPPVNNPPTNPPAGSAPFTPKGEFGMWVWTSPADMTDAYRTQLLATANTYSINTLYVTIDDYLDIYNLAPSASRTAKLNSYNDSVGKLLDAAKAANVSIDAEAGWKDWSDPAKRSNSYNMIDYVNAYNSSHTNDFRKLQFDVEPYLLSTYENNKASVLTTYVNYIGDITSRAINSGVDISLVIPHFYDSLQAWTPQVTYNGKTDYTFNHILRILDTASSDSVIIMAYRNTATGDDSTVQLSQQEIKDASTGVHNTKIIVAQEMGNVTPAYVTFYKKTKTYLWGQLTKVDNQFKASSGYNGIAIHYYEPFVALK